MLSYLAILYFPHFTNQIAQLGFQYIVARIRVPQMLSESLAVLDADQFASFFRQPLHGDYIFVDPVMRLEPASLTVMAAQHLFLCLHRRGYVNNHRGCDLIAETVHPVNGVQVVQIRNRLERLDAGNAYT